eukprot:2280008-Pleurochrysis_carterae.AAC.1
MLLSTTARSAIAASADTLRRLSPGGENRLQMSRQQGLASDEAWLNGKLKAIVLHLSTENARVEQQVLD